MRGLIGGFCGEYSEWCGLDKKGSLNMRGLIGGFCGENSERCGLTLPKARAGEKKCCLKKDREKTVRMMVQRSR